MKKMKIWTGLISLAFAVTAQADFGRATLEKEDEIWIMNLYGTREEMAYQHGALIKDFLGQTPLPYYAEKIDRMIDLNQSGLNHWFSKLMIHQVYLTTMEAGIPEEDTRVLEAFSKGSEYPLDKILTAYLFPDLGEYLLAKGFGENHLLNFGNLPPVSGLGCSTLVILPEKSKEGLLHARNLDFHAVGIWEKNQVIIYFHPSEPGAQPYAAVGSLGIPTAGITGFNQSGIIMDLHQINVDQTNIFGTPILSVTERVVREAHNLGEALRILESQKYTSSWKINLSSAKEKQAVSVDVSADHISVHPAKNGSLRQTNHVEAPELKSAEFSSTFRGAEDSLLRSIRLAEMTKDLKNATVIDASRMISRGKRQDQGSLTRPNNVQSIVFAPDQGVLYIGSPSVSYGRATDGIYYGFSMKFDSESKALDKKRSLAAASLDDSLASPFYRQALVKIDDEGDWNSGVDLILQAEKYSKNDPFYSLMAGLVLFKLAGMKQSQELLDKAYLHLEFAKAQKPGNYHQKLIQLFEARYFDLKGNRAQATRLYSASDTSYTPAMHAAYAEGKKSAYTLDQLSEIKLDMINGDLYKF